GFPVGIHVFGYAGWPLTNSGWPSFYIEEMTEHATGQQAVVASMIFEGVFEQFRDLKVVLIESGFGWLPALGWRLDKHWERMRDEVPHVKRPPSEYIRDRKSTRLNSSHSQISYAVFCLKKKKKKI